jgi:hypothetical protein
VLIKEPASVVFVENASKAPWMVLKWLDVLYLNEENVAWFGCLDLEWAGEVVYLSQVDVFYVVGAIVILDLSAGPVEAFDLNSLAVLDCAAEGD